METTRKITAYFMLLVMVFCVFSETAAAAGTFSMVACDTNGNVTVDSTTNKPGGLFPPEKLGDTVCEDPEEGKNPKIFSMIVCNFVGILNDTLSRVYCALQYKLLPVLTVVLSIYIVVFGAQVLTGRVNLTSNSAIAIHLLKIGGIWAFASINTVAIGLLYNLFIGITVQSIDWVLSIIDLEEKKFDFLGFTFGTDTSLGNLFTVIDERLYAVVNGVKEAATGVVSNGLFSDNARLIVFFIMLSFIFPPLFLVVVSLFAMTISVFARAVISFLMGISAVAFLIALSPIYLSFILFRSTVHLFENWLKHMIAYTLQPMITFAIFALWIAVTSQFVGFIDELSKVMADKTPHEETGVINTPNDTIGFCKLTYWTFGDVPSISCQDDADLKNQDKLIPPSKMLEDRQFIYFLSYHFITLLIVTYAFSAIMKSSAEISRNLAGPNVSVPLGSNFGSGAGIVHSASRMFGGGGKHGGGGGGARSSRTSTAAAAVGNNSASTNFTAQSANTLGTRVGPPKIKQ